jgi:hypothetical protein
MNIKEEHPSRKTNLSPAFLADSISITQSLLRDVLLKIDSMEDFTVEREFHLNQQIMDLTLSISSFVEVTTLLSKFLLRSQNQSIAGIKDSHIHLLSIMKGVQQAQSKLDHVALEDLIKYELKDNLTQWNIDLLPQIKRTFGA